MTFLLLLLLSIEPALAEKEILFGPEFTFTNSRMMADNREHRIPLAEAETLAARILERCPGCRRDGPKSRTILFPEGFWIEVSADPAVVEVKMKPMGAKEFAEHREVLQKVLFDGAKSLGMAPSPSVGSGHINIDIASAFGNDALLFRNFMVDSAYHPELFQGMLGDNRRNAIAVADMSAEGREAFAAEIARFDLDRQASGNGSARMSLEDLRQALDRAHAKGGRTAKWVAVALAYHDRVEVRGVFAQNSAEEYLKQIRLFEARIRYLSTLKEPIPLRVPDRRLSWREKLDRFRGYVTESGLGWGDYRAMHQSWYWRSPLEFPPCSWALRMIGR